MKPKFNIINFKCPNRKNKIGKKRQKQQGSLSLCPIRFTRRNERRFCKDKHRMIKVLLKVTPNPETIKILIYSDI